MVDPDLAERLFGWGDTGEWISGTELVAVARAGVELHGGEVAARKAGGAKPVLTLRVLRATGWKATADDVQIVARLRAAFPNAVPLPKGAWHIPPGPNRVQ